MLNVNTGATQTRNSDKVWCKMFFPKKASIIVPGNIAIIRENWNLKYSACFILCSIPPNPDVPESVSIISDEKNAQKSSNLLPVLHSKSGGTGTFEVNSDEIGVCVKPMHYHYNKTLELVEFLELNQLLGVTKFTFYSHTISEHVRCILKHYEQQGIVEVLPWDLDIQSQKEIRTEGIFAALNDCLYRNMNSFKYLMLTDFDEFIVPHTSINTTSIPQMLKHVEENSQKNGQTSTTSAYYFQNAFFYLQFPDDSEAKYNLRVLQKTRRKTMFNPQRQRSKYICKPRNIKEVGNHFIWEFFKGSSLNVPTKLGYLHHYRICEFGGDDCVKAENHVDRTMFSFQDELFNRVKNVLLELSVKCKLDYLKVPLGI